MENMNNPEDDIQHLIIRYLDGLATDGEILSLQEWLSRSEENFSLFNDYRKYWLQSGVQGYNTELAWQYLNRHLAKKTLVSRSGLWLKVVGVAAAIVLLVSTGYLGIKYFDPVHNEKLADQTNIEPGSKKAILMLGSNEKIELNNYSTDTLVRDEYSLKREGSTLIYNDLSEVAPAKEEYNSLITPRGGEYSVVLSDGTRVWLNAESELKYPVLFTGNERKVFLKGEAYFSVTKKEGQSFVVCSDKARITVLGTEFNVNNYEEDALVTTLVKGSVVVAHANGGERHLNPGQQAIVNKEGEVEVHEVETELFTSWKDGYFVYRDIPLEEILKELSRWYDFTYFYQNNSLGNMVLTAKLRKFDRVEKIFEILSATGRFGFITKGSTVTIVAK